MTSAPNPASTAAQWPVDELDLEAYLGRIGQRGPVAADDATLVRLHRAHVAKIPFENLDVVLGRSIAVDLAAVQEKLVYRRRGGYCFEQNLLFAAVLQRIGFQVKRILARTGDPLEDARARSHLVLQVNGDGGPWLADVGFGSGLLEPISLAEGFARQQGKWTNRLVRGIDAEWRLQESTDGSTFKTRYTFGERPDYPIDIAVANYYISTNPRSPFIRQIVIIRKDDSSVRSLIGREFSIEFAGGSTEKRQVADSELEAILSEEFHINLAHDRERQALLNAMGHE